MSSPLNVDPDQLVTLANGHIALADQYGQIIADFGTPPAGGWPSQAHMAATRAATNGMSAAMAAQLTQHAGAFGATAAQYTGQEQASSIGLKPEACEAMLSDMLKSAAGMGTDLFKSAESVVANLGQVAAAAGSSFVAPAAAAAASFMPKPPAAQVAPAAGTTPAAAAPPAADSADSDRERERAR